jgi:hypothetical protein
MRQSRFTNAELEAKAAAHRALLTRPFSKSTQHYRDTQIAMAEVYEELADRRTADWNAAEPQEETA